jgi:ABC-type thiamine transport system ATPase subunit
VIPDSGEILLDGKPAHFKSPIEARRAGIETVYQDLAVAPALDIATNLFLGREQRRKGPLGSLLRMVDKADMKRQAGEHMRNLQIGIRSMSQAVETLSGGQRQGVAVARAPAWARKLVIMDEPTAALGVRESGQVLELIRRVRDRRPRSGVTRSPRDDARRRAAGRREPEHGSHVVNAQRVDDRMEARVRDAIAVLGYRPNVTASSLRRAAGGSASVGLVFEDVANPFFSAVHRGVEDILRSRGMLTFAGSSDEEPDRERELAEAFASRGVDGLIIAPAGGDQSYLGRDRDAGMALVFVNRPPRFLDADSVVCDNFGGAMAACEHLISHGHRRIGFLGDRPEIHTSVERFRGYRAALARHSIAEDPHLIRHSLFRALDACETTRELMLARRPRRRCSPART